MTFVFAIQHKTQTHLFHTSSLHDSQREIRRAVQKQPENFLKQRLHCGEVQRDQEPDAVAGGARVLARAKKPRHRPGRMRAVQRKDAAFSETPGAHEELGYSRKRLASPCSALPVFRATELHGRTREHMNEDAVLLCR